MKDSYPMAMGMDAPSLTPEDSLSVARQRVTAAPFPEWSVLPEYDRAFVGRAGDPLTYLLASRQVHAERKQTLHHSVTRLQSVEAVQHQSQWRLSFEPLTQKVFLHWIRIHRGGVTVDHSNLARLRLLQREEGLEGQVLDGWCTLLLVIEDVRPGDLLDTCFSIESRPRLMPEHCFAMFTVPQPVSIGQSLFSVRFDAGRPMRWKASTADFAPAVRREDAEVIWTWEQRDQAAPTIEPNTPEWYLPFPWIQVADAPDWTSVSREVCAAWTEEPEDAEVGELAAQISAATADPLEHIQRALQVVQEEHRYLSVNAELGGQVPSPPGLVARRRYGDCKDLSFLLVHLLRRLGIAARPVLVHAGLRRQLIEMLPSPSLFNHVVVEFQHEGHTRWVDATSKRQGGGALERFIPDFGVGLPVDPAGTGLSWPPPESIAVGLCEVRETFLIDTSGGASQLAVTVLAHGGHAEALRQRWETAGAEELAKERFQQCLQRFGEVKRIGALRHRDDRATNEFALAEIFEINRILRPHHDPGYCEFAFPNSLIASTLPMPPEEKRRTPWALAYPCNVDYTVVIESQSLHPMGSPRRVSSTAQFEVIRRDKSLHNYLGVTFQVRILRDHVEPDGLEEYRRQVAEVWKNAFFGLHLPLGHARPRGSRFFGELPERPLGTSFPLPVWTAPTLTQPARAAAGPPDPARPISFIAANTAEPEGAERFDPEHFGEPRRRRHRPKERNDAQRKVILVAVIGSVVIFLLICFALARLGS